jgi:hypothetical protein
MSKFLVLDKSQLCKPVEIETVQGEYGIEIVVTRGSERARLVVDYFAGKVRVKQFGRKDYSADAELGRLDVEFQ